MEDARSPEWIRVKIKESKTDRMRQGALVTVYRTRKKVCPVEALLRFIVVRNEGRGPFFKDENGKGLTRRVFVTKVKKELKSQGVAA